MKKILLLFLSIIVFSACNEPMEEVKQKESNSSANAEPAPGCPSGYTWDPYRRECVPTQKDPEINSYGDLNMAQIKFDATKAYFGPAPDKNKPYVKPLITPGGTINGKQYFKTQYYNNGKPMDAIMLLGIKRVSGYDYVDYYDRYGKRYGLLKVYQDKKQGWTPTYAGSVGGTSFQSRGFTGRWGECVAGHLSLMTNGSALGAAYGLGCMIFGPECAIAIGVGCLIYN